MVYLLDSNVFIQAKNFHYGFDFCPGFWDWLTTNNKKKSVFSVEKVSNELDAGDDELSEWASGLDSNFFLEPDAKMLPALGEVSTWVTGQKYEPVAINTFLQVADYYLVAHALAYKYTVVTHERLYNSTKKIGIPNVCIGLGIKFMSPFEMLRHEKAKFVLGLKKK